MLTADQRKELEALQAEMELRANTAGWRTIRKWASRIAAVLANGEKQT